MFFFTITNLAIKRNVANEVCPVGERNDSIYQIQDENDCLLISKFLEKV
jgi:hypothetical protein